MCNGVNASHIYVMQIILNHHIDAITSLLSMWAQLINTLSCCGISIKSLATARLGIICILYIYRYNFIPIRYKCFLIYIPSHPQINHHYFQEDYRHHCQPSNCFDIIITKLGIINCYRNPTFLNILIIRPLLAHVFLKLLLSWLLIVFFTA